MIERQKAFEEVDDRLYGRANREEDDDSQNGERIPPLPMQVAHRDRPPRLAESRSHTDTSLEP